MSVGMPASGTWPGFYTARDVARLAQIPPRTLYEWQQRKIIKPSLELEGDDGKTIQRYTYADLVLIRILRALREDKIDFTSAAIAIDHLFARLGPPSRGWADAHVYFRGKRIYAWKPDDWDVTEATAMGQKVETRAFGDVFPKLRRIEEGISIVVPEKYWGHVDIDPRVKDGQPVVHGTRIPTSALADLARRLWSPNRIAQAYGIAVETVGQVLDYERRLEMASPAAVPAAAV